MAMLDRYRKPGGFVQLLALVETCGQAKQEKFLELIRAEDARWADSIKQKMLDIQRIYSWNDDTLAEIVGTLQDLTVATAIAAAPEAVKARINGYLSHGRKRKIEDLSHKAPTAAEVASTHVKIIETVRKMSSDGFLRFEKFDDSLVLEDEIEEKLSRATLTQLTPQAASASSDFTIEYENAEGETAPAPAQHAPSANDEQRLVELSALKKRAEALAKENAVLRHELSLARAKLEQIKKIA